ncbi:guanylate-binding protein 1 isoform X1 [Chelonia mydas]|uniref:guanylate-binding protein 1 isoform X1 n=2 Tax=Chelonia mydas TaxID=8469 RepID=UPI0018A1BE8E|nr:guanylate-binding protein 1 isoform X1 [Chelonia mydas]
MSWCKKWRHVPAQRQQRGGASGRFAAGQPDTRRCANAVLSALVKSYMDTTHSGNVPCLVDAVMATENEMGVTEALAHYVAEKETRVAFPAAMMELSERHGKSLADALQLFMQLSLKAETVRPLATSSAEMKHLQGTLPRVAGGALGRCVEEAHGRGLHATWRLPGSYQDLRDQSRVVNFRTTPNNGVKAEEVLDQFLASETAATDAILRADKTLTEAEEEKASTSP